MRFYGFKLSLTALVFLNFYLFGQQAVALIDLDEEKLTVLQSIEYSLAQTRMEPASDDQLVKKFLQMGFDDVTPFFAPFTTQVHVAHILSSPDFEKVIVIRYDFVPTDSSLLGQVLKLDSNSFLMHTKNLSKRHVAVYLEGFKQVEINRILLSVQQSSTRLTSQRWSPGLSMLIPKAHAETLANSMFASMTPDHRAMVSGALKSLSECSGAFVEALWEAAVGKTFINGISLLFKGQIFSEIRMAIKLGRFVGQLAVAWMFERQDKMRTITNNSQFALNMACSMMGGMTADWIIAAISGGASLPFTLVKWTERIKHEFSRLRLIAGVTQLDHRVRSVTKVITPPKIVGDSAHAAERFEKSYESLKPSEGSRSSRSAR